MSDTSPDNQAELREKVYKTIYYGLTTAEADYYTNWVMNLIAQNTAALKARIAAGWPKLPYNEKQLKHHYINEALDWNGYTNELAKIEALAAAQKAVDDAFAGNKGE